MPNLPRPKLVQVDPPGPWIVPVVEAFLNSAIDPLSGRVQLHFVLHNGAELHIPLTDTAYQRLKDVLAMAPDAPGMNEQV